jgi:uncharacterized membrane protein YgaE (UPF0421/DUF939 family)
MTAHKYLRYTNLLLVIPILYFLFSKKKPIAEYILAIMLVFIIITSQLFWNNPIKQSQIDTIDSIIAKIVMISFCLYIVSYKFKFSFLLVLLAICISFYFSNYYSNQEWCSNEHIIYHGILHIFCFVATFYAFTF